MEDNILNYYLYIDDESGISKVSLVKHPAVQYDFLLFNEAVKFTSDDEQKIVTGVIMLADVPILRIDPTRGKHYVTFTGETIKKIVLKYFKEMRTSSVNLEHSINIDGVYMFESYIVDRSRGINPPKEFAHIPDGSWIGSYKIENDEVWNDIKAGKFKGFSIEGAFNYEFSEDNDNNNDKFYIDLYKVLNKNLINK